MDAIHTRLDTRWLTAAGPDGQPMDAEGPVGWTEPVPAGGVERLDLELGAHVCRVRHRFPPGRSGLLAMSEVRAALAEPVLFVQVTHAGGGVLEDRRLERRLTHAPGGALFLHLDRIEQVHWADTAAPLDLTALVISRSRLRRFLGAATARELLAALSLTGPPAASQRTLAAPLAALLQASVSPALTGPLRQLHAQARVLDFLVALASLLAGDAPAEARQRERLEQVRAELDRWPGLVPDLGELAQRHGFSARALNTGFKREFGQTLCAYVADLRLEAAQAVLRDTRVPLKTVAARLGYASVSHFSQAFTRKFGVRPGALRRES